MLASLAALTSLVALGSITASLATPVPDTFVPFAADAGPEDCADAVWCARNGAVTASAHREPAWYGTTADDGYLARFEKANAALDDERPALIEKRIIPIGETVAALIVQADGGDALFLASIPSRDEVMIVEATGPEADVLAARAALVAALAQTTGTQRPRQTPWWRKRDGACVPGPGPLAALDCDLAVDGDALVRSCGEPESGATEERAFLTERTCRAVDEPTVQDADAYEACVDRAPEADANALIWCACAAESSPDACTLAFTGSPATTSTDHGVDPRWMFTLLALPPLVLAWRRVRVSRRRS